MAFNVSKIRQQFPLINSRSDIVYLDTAATAQKPQAVLDAEANFYKKQNANVHRSMHGLAEEATTAYEEARETVQKFINAAHKSEIVFTKNCTEALNLVARSWGSILKPGDGVALTLLEHHSQIVPWLQLKERLGIKLHWIEVDDQGMPKLDQLDKALESAQIKLVAVTGQSNVLGVKPDLTPIITKAHLAGALVCVDAAQWIVHNKIDVEDLNCDFLAFSGHKLYGPTGIGVLYAKRELLEEMPPFLGGGSMIQTVNKEEFIPTDPPEKFEAGTPPIAQAVGLAAAIDWLNALDQAEINHHEEGLIKHAYEVLNSIEGVTILGPKNPAKASGCASFTLEGVHPHDLTDLLGAQGICLRAGHHCTQPLHDYLGIPASTRLSVGLYNTKEEIDKLPGAIDKIKKTLIG